MVSMCRLSFMYLLMFSMVCMIFSIIFLFKDLVYMIEWEIISMNSSSILMMLLMDWMSLMFMGFVLFISSMVILYSEDYMGGDININRFILLVLAFVMSMMLMIISPNLISILLGWDGLGLVSYCLVIYYQNSKSFNAGMLTVLMNRVGDVTMLLSIAWMMNYGGWNFLMYIYYMSDVMEYKMIGVLLMISAMTKSAQIPFSAWLPAAMAAPTPVSALVHSSTLVTAGVYLMIRFNELIMSSDLGMVLLLISSLTMFMSGLGANFETDLKKIIALSTLSQLGLMMSSLSFGMYKLAFFHLLMHALFKALLFLCAGSIIHLCKNLQDIRIMGAMSGQLPLVGMVLSMANLALCGLPFLAGFYSKDMILESYSSMNFNYIIYFLFYFSTGLTVCYSFRLSILLFMSSMKMFSLILIKDLVELKVMMMYSLFILSIFCGSSFSWFIFVTPSVMFISVSMKLLVLMVMILGAWIGFEISSYSLSFYKNMNKKIMYFMGGMWFMPLLSVYFIYYPLLSGSKMMKSSDQGWFEFMGSQNMHEKIKNFSVIKYNFQNNMFMLFLMSMFFWLLVMLMLYLL
uniref:NADH dehydrogenase subunit 5 n=1 Tax=Neopsylla specialis TaxID=129382 RepID=UPI002410EDE1|nr:NADH dehydrogenase subunit 5 [Neopsylla specialis]WEQ92384.1 NADH dehydrogenase subunit 5 [Neopsylla specialis]